MGLRTPIDYTPTVSLTHTQIHEHTHTHAEVYQGNKGKRGNSDNMLLSVCQDQGYYNLIMHFSMVIFTFCRFSSDLQSVHSTKLGKTMTHI